MCRAKTSWTLSASLSLASRSRSLASISDLLFSLILSSFLLATLSLSSLKHRILLSHTLSHVLNLSSLALRFFRSNSRFSGVLRVVGVVERDLCGEGGEEVRRSCGDEV